MKENRGVLARLMAIENITVEHRHAPTASFDVFNRVLTLPTWKNMSAELYDMLRAHEVGHALETPAAGWHDTVIKDKQLRSFLNVLEDARIEKLMKQRYPGLRPSFVKGYKELYDQDFFGTANKNLKSLLLIDRINLHFKIGSYLNVPFNFEEQKIVREVEQLQTWDDVVRLARSIFQIDEEEFNRKLQEQEMEFNNGHGDNEDGFETDDDVETEGDQSNDADQNNDKVGNRGRGITAAPSVKTVLDDWYTFESQEQHPQSLTDYIFRLREQELLDNKSMPFCYVDVPKANLNRVIIGHRTVASQFVLREEMLKEHELMDMIKFAEYKQNFLAKNKRYVDHLVREFELKRNARQMARAGTAKTGALNLKKVHRFQLTDDIFQRMTVVPKGKNHGMIMVFDQSGSMGEYYAQTLEQIMILAMFCRKINVPFHVYGFTDNHDHTAKNFNFLHDFDQLPDTFSKVTGELNMAEAKMFRLREYLTHTQTSTEFKAMIERLMILAATWDYSSKRRYTNPINILPLSERLHGTPLNEAITSLMTLVPEFRKAHRLDVVNTIILTDGQSNTLNRVYTSADSNGRMQTKMAFSRGEGAKRLIVRDQRTKLEAETLSNYVIGDNAITSALLKLFKKVTDSRCVGYFIGGNHRGYVKEWYQSHNFTAVSIEKVIDDAMLEIKRNGFLQVNAPEVTGFDAYYRISKKSMETDNETLEVEKGAKLAQIRKAFLSVNSDKRKHRVLLSNFVDSIA